MVISCNELEQWMESEEKWTADSSVKVEGIVGKYKPTICSIELEKEKVMFVTEESAAAKMETVDHEWKKLVSREKRLRLDRDGFDIQLATLKSRIENEKRRAEVLDKELLSLKETLDNKNWERKEKKKQLKEKYDAHLIALSYYKQKMQCYLDLEDEDQDICTLYFFISDRNAPRKDYFVKLKYKNDEWQLLMMTPLLPSFDQLQEKLRENNDIQGFIAHVHKCFVHLKEASG